MNMKQLVIAEKPSVAMAIASVLGASGRNEGFMEGREYIVSWCCGHLTELAGAEAYDERYIKWKREDLPIIPEQFRSKVIKDKFKQISVLRQLLCREDVSEVINACDAGREGELIFRNMYDLAGCNKKVLRLWISSMEDREIKRGFSQLWDSSEFDRLYAGAVCRQRADWLVGINATRLFSVTYHRTLNVGRVLSPTLSMIVQREAEIESFTPEKTFTPKLIFEDFSAIGEKYSELSSAQEAAKAEFARVVSVDVSEHEEKAPKLYDLTTLQRDANRLLGYTAMQTLDYLQSLYEKKLITYPRTDSRYLTEDMRGTVLSLASRSAFVSGFPIPITVFADNVCNNSKVSDHHAIILTPVAETTKLISLPRSERELVTLIAIQTLKALACSHVYRETVVKLEANKNLYTARGREILNVGWRYYNTEKPTEKILPELVSEQLLEIREVDVIEGETTPPDRFTEDTLLSAMERAGEGDMPKESERRGLGTPATRAATIEKLISAGFAERKKGRKKSCLVPTELGMSLVTVLPMQLQSPLWTAEWESRLRLIEQGELSPESFLSDIGDLVTSLVRDYKPVDGAQVLFPSGRRAVGICPRCSGPVTESKAGFFCDTHDCKFGLWRDNKYISAHLITLDEKLVSALLKDGKASVKGVLSPETEKLYDGVLTLKDDGTKSVYVFEIGK